MRFCRVLFAVPSMRMRTKPTIGIFQGFAFLSRLRRRAKTLASLLLADKANGWLRTSLVWSCAQQKPTGRPTVSGVPGGCGFALLLSISRTSPLCLARESCAGAWVEPIWRFSRHGRHQGPPRLRTRASSYLWQDREKPRRLYAAGVGLKRAQARDYVNEHETAPMPLKLASQRSPLLIGSGRLKEPVSTICPASKDFPSVVSLFASQARDSS